MTAVLTLRNVTGTRRTSLVVFAALVVAFFWCYAAVCRLLVEQWWSNSMYSYAFLIPLISGYVIWTGRHRLMAAASAPSYRAGVPTLALGLLLLLAGRAGSVASLQEVSILPTISGLVLLAGGVSLLRAAWFPIAYLLFMIPIWDVVTGRMHAPFQTLSAAIGEFLLRALQVPTFRTATTIQLPTVTLEVAEACSGVNYLIAIAAVAIPYAYMSVAGHLRRVTVIALAVVVAVLSNGLRVALIGASQFYGLWADIHGPGHVFHGVFVAVVGYGALFLGASVLGGPSSPASTGMARRPVSTDRPSWQSALSALAGATVTLLAVALWLPRTETTAVAPARDLSALPFMSGEWVATHGSADASAIRVSSADAELARTYLSSRSGELHVYVGYYATQRQGRELVGHGGARVPSSVTPVTLELASGRRERVAEAVVDAGGRRRFVMFWYDVDGRITANSYRAKALTAWASLFHGRSNGALVVLTLDAVSGIDPGSSRSAVKGFASAALPAIQRYLASDR